MGDSDVAKTAPPGYTFDLQGNLVHMVYDEGGHAALGIKGVVIPSAKVGGDVGGNVAFDPHRMDIPQNIVESTDDGMRVVSKTTRAEMIEKQSTADAPAQGVPAPESFLGGADGQLSVSLSGRGGAMTKKQSKKRKAKAKEKAKAEETLQRGEESPEPVQAAPVPVTIAGPFGQIVQQFTAIFRDGNLVVLATDHRQLPVAYKFPELEDGLPLPLQIGWSGQVVQCLWARISFTLPDRSATFSVLFVNEERPDEQGFPGQASPD